MRDDLFQEKLLQGHNCSNLERQIGTVGGTGAVNPPTLSDVRVEEVNGELSSPAIMSEVGTNQPEMRHPTKVSFSRCSPITKNIRRAASRDDS